MYVLVFVDNVNESFGDNSIDDNTMLIGVSDDVDKLKQLVKQRDDDIGSCHTQWNVVYNRIVGKTIVNTEFENDEDVVEQYHLILSVDQI